MHTVLLFVIGNSHFSLCTLELYVIFVAKTFEDGVSDSANLVATETLIRMAHKGDAN